MFKNLSIKAISLIIMIAAAMPASAQFNLKKAVGAASKAAQAVTLTDEQMAAYVKESVDWMDKNNPVPDENNEYTKRLRRLTDGLKDADGIPLNFKVYEVIYVIDLAWIDGSVRVFSSLMDIMSDDELLGIIGHEIGHVARRHSKNSFKTQLLTGAAKDAVGSTSSMAAALTEAPLGSLGEGLINPKYSPKQETEADDAVYEFLVANGKHPWGMVMAFEKFQKREGESGSTSNSVQKMFSSHP